MAWVEGRVHGANVYSGYRRGVITLDRGFWIVYDVLGADAPMSSVSYAFQLAPGADARQAMDGSVVIDADGERVVIVPSEGLGPASITCGRLDPPGGWVSHRYGHVVAAPQIRFGSLGTRRDTAFVIAQTHAGLHCRSVAIEVRADGGCAIEVVWTEATDRIVIPPAEAPTSSEPLALT
jgi:hypothetical protein